MAYYFYLIYFIAKIISIFKFNLNFIKYEIYQNLLFTFFV